MSLAAAILLSAILILSMVAIIPTMVYAQVPPTTTTTNTTTTGSLNATNATAVTAPTPTIITQLIGVRGEVIPLHAENIQFQQEDPLFAKLVQVINDCMNFVVAQYQ